MLTRKHFEQLADCLAAGIDAARDFADCEVRQDAIRDVARRIADIGESENPRFDRNLFLASAVGACWNCGANDWGRCEDGAFCNVCKLNRTDPHVAAREIERAAV